MSDYTSAMYGGAPDECNHCWPTKLVDGYCPNKGCPESREEVMRYEHGKPVRSSNNQDTSE